ncbi:unnamed protein product [Sphagnum tenellum]
MDRGVDKDSFLGRITSTSSNRELLQACQAGNIDKVQSLIQLGVDLNSQKHFTKPPLTVAAEHGHIDLVNLLIRFGANVNGGEITSTALLAASKSGHKDIVQILLEAGADVNQWAGIFPMVPITVASQFGHLEIIQLLMRSGADVNNDESFQGQTPLHMAILHKNIEVALYLINHGADLYAMNEYCARWVGKTPFDMADDSVKPILIDAYEGYQAQAINPRMNTPTLAAKLPKDLEGVGITEHLGEQLSINELLFRDDEGSPVVLGKYFKENRPVILAFVYYGCPSLCNLLLNGLEESLHKFDWTTGDQFEFVAVSMNPLETPELAAKKKANYLKRYNRPKAGQGWHFLTGEEEQIKKLASQIGFQYRYDETQKQYIHAAALYILTPQGGKDQSGNVTGVENRKVSPLNGKEQSFL